VIVNVRCQPSTWPVCAGDLRTNEVQSATVLNCRRRQTYPIFVELPVGEAIGGIEWSEKLDIYFSSS
jgi:hypothetical protein